ncbi:hypothetical protein [Parasitella parasitica]|uniref:Bifunctional chorismate mutase/prephenate dehydratase n=1 Tax=Parasitella parasitica TaxID=35722 RepID=A0A0B7MU78_9FUNG|nr:hypothetical protein [Parasitella parasitica]
MSDLPALRQKIDSLDATLVNILNERARVSLDIGVAKRKDTQTDEKEEADVQVFRPGREQEIYKKLTRLNSGPLNDDSLQAIFREIMSASIALQKNVSIAYLGPPGTFSHQAAYKRLGDSVAYVPQKQIEGKVRAETYLPCIAIHKGLGQTQKWLSAHIPHAKRIPVKSTAEAAQKAALETGAAAVCSEICAELYGLDIVEANIEDLAANTTRFLLIGAASDSPSKDDHTLITFTVDHRQPGALCDGLKVFKDYGLNLFKIDSRPSGQRPWHYVFFVECSGHFENEDIKKALKDLEKFCLDIVVLGSFPNQRPE